MALPCGEDVGPARVGNGPRPLEALPRRDEVCREPGGRELRVATVQVGERLPGPHGVADIRVETDDRALERDAHNLLLPREEAADRLDASVDRATLHESGRDAHRRGPGGAGLRPGSAREPESEQQAGGDARAGGGDADWRGRGCHGSVAFIVNQGVVQWPLGRRPPVPPRTCARG